MKKIISLFQRNYDGDRLVRNEVVPGAEWVLSGEGEATRKFDGTCCMVRDGKLYKRYDAKAGKKPPEGFESAQEPDPVTGHWPGWLPIGFGDSDKWHRDVKFVFLHDSKFFVVFSDLDNGIYYREREHSLVLFKMPDGTYELCGPKIQGNTEGFYEHVLVRHGCEVLDDCPLDFDGLKEYLSNNDIEGVVWHHPDGRMVKIKAKDFGLSRR